MPWYDGLTFEEVELAIREGRAPGSQDGPGGYWEVPSGFIDWLYAQKDERVPPHAGQIDGEVVASLTGSRLHEVTGGVIADNHARDQLLVDEASAQARSHIEEFRAQWRRDSELIALAKEMERARIAEILRAKAREYGEGSDEWEALLDAALWPLGGKKFEVIWPG